jgi:hypothetical protein
VNCRHCGKFTPRCTQKRRGRRKYCNAICYGLGQRGKSRDDRTSPSKKVYIQIRHEDGTREYWHRFVYRQENGDIPEGFVIHHKNEMKHDNGPDNLGALPANEHTPNEHWHWRTREPDRERYVPVGETDPDIPF